jgi:hypothetical protein
MSGKMVHPLAMSDFIYPRYRSVDQAIEAWNATLPTLPTPSMLVIPGGWGYPQFRIILLPITNPTEGRTIQPLQNRTAPSSATMRHYITTLLVLLMLFAPGPPQLGILRDHYLRSPSVPMVTRWSNRTMAPRSFGWPILPEV